PQLVIDVMYYFETNFLNQVANVKVIIPLPDSLKSRLQNFHHQLSRVERTLDSGNVFKNFFKNILSEYIEVVKRQDSYSDNVMKQQQRVKSLQVTQSHAVLDYYNKIRAKNLSPWQWQPGFAELMQKEQRAKEQEKLAYKAPSQKESLVPLQDVERPL